MLRVILNRLMAKAEKLLAEKRVSPRLGRSGVDQVFSSRVITEKHLHH